MKLDIPANAQTPLRLMPLAAEAKETKSIVGEKRVVRRLFEALNASNVRYCHWKSNVRLDQTIAGDQDIDLLVDPQDAAALQAVLLDVGFKTTWSRSGIGHPAVFHALALDENSATLVDLHAYFQIVSGDSLVKNYRLPVEGELLSRSRFLHGVKVPIAECELAIFVIRMALKHLSLVEILKVRKHCDEVVKELAWLREQATDDQAAAFCTAWFPNIDSVLFKQFVEALAGGRLLGAIVLGRRMGSRLKEFRRLGPITASLSRQWRLRGYLRKKLHRRRDLVFLSGGAIIALVGPKGTGKSTLAGDLATRLGRYLDVWQIHAGKPPATMLSFLPRLALPAARMLMRRKWLSAPRQAERCGDRSYSTAHLLRLVLIAYDRHRLLRQAQRAATSGTIVISDRYPSGTIGAPDSCHSDATALAKTPSRFKRWLMRRERELYQNLPRPRLIIRLDAPLETAIERDASRRKPGGPDAETIRRRWYLENESRFDYATTVRIDACRDFEETAASVARAAWRVL